MNRGSVDFLLRATNFLPDLNFYSLGFGRIGKNPIGLVGIVEGIRSFFFILTLRVASLPLLSKYALCPCTDWDTFEVTTLSHQSTTIW